MSVGVVRLMVLNLFLLNSNSRQTKKFDNNLKQVNFHLIASQRMKALVLLEIYGQFPSLQEENLEKNEFSLPWLSNKPLCLALIQLNKTGVSALTQAIGQVLKESPHLGSLLARNGKIVAVGYVVTGLEGEVCHHRTVQKNEGKVHIECVYDDSAPIWDPPQGDDYYKLSSHVGGGWIVWYKKHLQVTN
ncbi:hypothetical protein C5167_021095 [Papaver somniferum]|uniref:DUF8039 domain-containing protein n=1 Tax=Papaver somniferum TaxID=3469 RepID=A0A4Y7IVE5_PAPSO|nr:hypothetical protein C5167_021095 [Papaver somniferum]